MQRAGTWPAGSGSRWIGRVLPARARTRVARVLCSAPVGSLVGWLYGDLVPCYGLRFHVPTPPVAHHTKAQLRLGIYEGSEIRFVRRWLRPDLDVVELGSSLGVVASHCAQRLTPGARLLCVEANPALLPVLRANLARHAGDRQVAIVNRAVAYDRDEVELAVGPDTSVSRVGAGGGVRVAATTLGTLLRDHAIDRYALVCDIEGAEAGILERDADALRGCRQLLAELHDAEWEGTRLHPEDLAARIRAAGFVERARHGPVYVFERPEPPPAATDAPS